MSKNLTSKQYNLAIGVILLWGFAINVIMCTFFQDVFVTWNPVAVIIGYFIVAIIGICMSIFSDNTIISFIGYNLVILPVGVVLSISLEDYYVSSVLYAFIQAALITLLMIVIATIKPEIFESMGRTLFICLTGAIVIEFIMIFVGVNPRWWDWIVALIFCGYIGYDWTEAQKKRKTLDNAVDSAMDLYLDIINLFVRLLGDKDDD